MRRFLITMALALAADLAAAADRVALVIGNGAYASVGRLDNPARDVALVAAELSVQGFEVTSVTDLGLAAMQRAVRAFRSKADKASIVLVYYAGHGIEIGGENYLIPIDAKLADARDAPTETVTVKSMLAQISGARRLKMIVLDACRNNPFAAKMRRLGRGRSVGRGLGKIEAAMADTLVAYAAAAGEITPDGDPGGNSPFTAAFVKALQGPPSDVRRMLGYVRDIMRTSVPGAEPFVYNSLGGDEYIINPKGDASLKSPKVEPGATSAREAAGLLVRIGLLPATGETVTGTLLASALSRFQRENGLAVTGRADPTTLIGLRVAVRYTERAIARLAAAPRPGKRPGGGAGGGAGASAAGGKKIATAPSSGRPSAGSPAPTVSETSVAGLTPGTTFRDCPSCPPMVVLPSGSFLMGAEKPRDPHTTKTNWPVRKVTLPPFAMARTEVTFAQWQACVDDGGCRANPDPDDNGWGRGSRPLVGVSWNDARAYIAWLNSKVSGRPYHLPSEAEWEYAARAGTLGAYPWGDRLNRDRANFGDEKCCRGATGGKDRWEFTAPAGKFPPNEFGLYDMHRNVSEWVMDCVHRNYVGAPTDGSPWLFENGGRCTSRVVRGGSWKFEPAEGRSSARTAYWPHTSAPDRGFRPARSLF